MIPENKLDDINKALQSTFGVTVVDNIEQLTTGLSNALVYRIVVKGRPYALKIARTDILSDPTLYYYTCMKPAAEIGIAPKIWYTGVEDGISIVDYVDLKPFPLADARINLAGVLSKLHSLPLFSKTIHSIDTLNRFVQKFRDIKIMPDEIKTEVFKSIERITSVYPRNKEELVPSHNDLKPENILYDGKKAWLSDWEAAFNNDRYSDLSIIANFIVTDEADEIEFLNRYFGRKVTEYERARFYLMRQITHMSYFTVFMIFVAASGPKINIDSILRRDFRDFHNRIWAGKISLAFNEPRLEYALVHLEQFRINMRTKRFEEALKIVSDSKLP
jgi:hypothetical protein